MNGLAASTKIPEPETASHLKVPHGHQVWYRLNGSVKPKTPLVVVHGGPGFSHHYLLSLVDLAANRPVYLYDQLDTGMSERPNDARLWTLQYFVDELDAVIGALAHKRVVVLGHSWGATVAAEWAARRPASLLGLVLGSAYLSEPIWRAENLFLRATLPENILEPLRRHESAKTTESAEYQDAISSVQKLHFCRTDPWPEYLLATFAHANMRMFEHMWGSVDFWPTGNLRDHEGTASLREIAVPTLVTAGEFDEAGPIAARRFAKLIPRGEYREFPGASHCPHIERRAEFMGAVEEFLSRIE